MNNLDMIYLFHQGKFKLKNFEIKSTKDLQDRLTL